MLPAFVSRVSAYQARGNRYTHTLPRAEGPRRVPYRQPGNRHGPYARHEGGCTRDSRESLRKSWAVLVITPSRNPRKANKKNKKANRPARETIAPTSRKPRHPCRGNPTPMSFYEARIIIDS